MPSSTRAWTRSTTSSLTSSWATWPHQVRTSVAASTSVGEPVLGLVERRRPHREAVLARRPSAIASWMPSRVDRADRRVRALLAELVPHRHPDRHAASACAAGTTIAPPRADDSRIASHSRAIRSPTSGGLGFGSRPSAHVEELLPQRLGSHRADRPQRRRAVTLELQPLAPDPGAQGAALAEHVDVGAQRRDRTPAAVHRDQGPRCQPRDDRAPDVDGAAVVLEPCGDLHDVLAGQVGDGVEHVGAGVEHEAPARQRRVLAPRAAVGASQFCHTSALTLRIVPSSPDRIIEAAARTCGERLPWKATTSSRPVRSRVRISSTASVAFMTMGFSSRTSRPASSAADACGSGARAGVTIITASSSSSRAVTSRKRCQSGSFGGRGAPRPRPSRPRRRRRRRRAHTSRR